MQIQPLKSEFLEELRLVLTAQQAAIAEASSRLSLIENSVLLADSQLDEIQEVVLALDEIEKQIEYLELEDLDEAGLNDEQLSQIFKRRQQLYDDSQQTAKYTTWPAFVKDSMAYCAINEIDELLPWNACLKQADFELLKKESYASKYRWDKWDYTFVGLAGVLGALTDMFIVRIPKTMTAGQYIGQKGSPVSEAFRKMKFPDSMQSWLEKVSKVPYDNTGGGDHRIDTFGHDPVLGFIIGVIDIVRGGATTIKRGKIEVGQGNGALGNPLDALVKQFLHMCSDVVTPKGLPVPFASIFRSMNVGKFLGPRGKEHTLSSLTGWMYHYGYDLRHFVTMSITPATIEIVLRAYIMLRHFSEYGEVSFTLAKNPKYRSMLLSSHAIACATNAGKVALQQGNPLAINYAEWLALLRYLMPSLKYWIFDRNQLELEHLARINDSGWNDLLTSSDALLAKLYQQNLEIVEIG